MFHRVGVIVELYIHGPGICTYIGRHPCYLYGYILRGSLGSTCICRYASEEDLQVPITYHLPRKEVTTVNNNITA